MKSLPRKYFYLIICTCLLAVLFGTQTAYAASFSVSTAAELIDAINTANSNNADDVITLVADITLTTVDNTNFDGPNGLPVIVSDGGHSLTINGGGHRIARSTDAGVPDFRILYVSGGSDLRLNHLILENGRVSGSGGGMYTSTSNPTLTDVTFLNNSAASNGGAIYNWNGSNPTLKNVTFLNNSANSGGGMYNFFSSSTLMNVTFSNNSANTSGGGIFNRSSSPALTNVTFSNNSANNGGGMFNGSSAPTLINVIIANSTSGGDCVNNLSTLNVNSKNNLIESSVSSCGLTNGVGGNIIGVDPNLGPLADNGGLTQTHALLTGSQAIDTADNTSCPATDQRGVMRPVDGDAIPGAVCDIGAYEFSSDVSFPTVIETSLKDTYFGSGPAAFTITFSEDVFNPTGNTSSNDVTNPANYLLVEDGVNGTFNTTSCSAGLSGDDIQITVKSVSYAPNTAKVNLSGELPKGRYRLHVCGTTSILDQALNPLNGGGADYIFRFTVEAAAEATSLPNTGFAPDRISSLSPQPANLVYQDLGDIWLEIPSLDVKASIFGVPQTDEGWSVDWLGSSAGWLHGTAFPTWEGNSVITAHVNNSNGLPGPFENIKSLKYGDQVIVHMFGQQYIFEVSASKLVFPNKTGYALEHLEDYSYLTLITCQWYNPITESYNFRRVVRTVLIEVQTD